MPYRTRELTQATWSDFAALFSRGNGGDHCWCVYHQRAYEAPPTRLRTRGKTGSWNRRQKESLVMSGQAHGILVYAGAEPVGWCQYGPASELSLTRTASSDDEPDWRVTCFVVDRRHRRHGVAALALRGALDAIRTRGGGIVESVAVVAWTHGRGRTREPVVIPGVGLVAPTWGGFSGAAFSGTLGMYEREQFVPAGILSSSAPRVKDLGAQGQRVRMRRRI